MDCDEDEDQDGDDGGEDIIRGLDIETFLNKSFHVRYHYAT